MSANRSTSLDALAKGAYGAVPDFLSLDEADAAIVKEARARYFDKARAERLVSTVAEKAEGRT
jgi:hypothetical protein